MAISIWCGDSKPDSVNEFLLPFVNELSGVLREGVTIGNHQVRVMIRCFTCDAPARAFIKGTVNFNHKNGCQRCEITGKFYNHAHRMSFPHIGASRTDKSFRERLQPEHHKEYSVLEKLPIDMVNDFPASDVLHLLHHGVMKKCLSMWIEGNSHYGFKWSKKDIIAINRHIIECNKDMPSDMHRSLRTLDFWKYWKATEFRTFLMYTGMVILKDFLETEAYEHFLTLCCAVRLCSSDSYEDMLPLVKNLFDEFVENFITMYGEDNVVSNVHNLRHIHRDVERFGNINSISTYKFENSLRLMKLNLQFSDSPLEQLSRRLIEMSIEPKLSVNTIDSVTFVPELKYLDESNAFGPRFKYLRFSANCFLSVKKSGDKWFLTQDRDIVEMKFAYRFGRDYYIRGNSIKKKFDFFTQPFSSNYANIFITESETNASKDYSIECIKCKLICLNYHNQYVFIPLLHSM